VKSDSGNIHKKASLNGLAVYWTIGCQDRLGDLSAGNSVYDNEYVG